ncbi:MAG: phosphoenolpyruvate--protein phosphotransferase [Candidatus Marinimicrobia bacterium]|nr:phosphoenolpyruvate--protein phosphotransferase [Candidatus Neomarinimicrobiota bacterium]
MRVLNGRTVVSGIAIGNICTLFSEEEKSVSHYKISDNNIESELTRFDKGLESARQELHQYISESGKNFDQTASKIFESHLMILSDKKLSAMVKKTIKDKKINAEHAIYDTFDDFIEKYEHKNLHFQEIVHDFKDVRDTLLEQFETKFKNVSCPIPEREPVIIAAKRLSPYMMSDLSHDNILAFVTEEGGFTTHASVLAASLDIPFIFNVPVVENSECNDFAIVDAIDEKFILHPDQKTIDKYEKKRVEFQKNLVEYKKISTQPAKTSDDIRLDLKVTVNLPNEIDLLEGHNFDGIGLLRTEFLFMDKNQPPSLEEQFQVYKHAARAASNKPVTIRLLDIGADKTPQYLNLPYQKNPDLGIKGARAVDHFQEVFETQVLALLKAAKFGDIRILFPMVADISDILTFKQLVENAENKSENAEFGNLSIGAMIETPSAAMLIDEILEIVDFINIGSNDLLQYTLAASRETPGVYKRYHSIHPALIKLIKRIVKKAKQHNKEASLCGEIANYAEGYPLFLDMGIESFSVPVSKHSIIKHKIAEINTNDLDGIKEKFIRARNKEEINNLLQKY